MGARSEADAAPLGCRCRFRAGARSSLWGARWGSLSPSRWPVGPAPAPDAGPRPRPIVLELERRSLRARRRKVYDSLVKTDRKTL